MDWYYDRTDIHYIRDANGVTGVTYYVGVANYKDRATENFDGSITLRLSNPGTAPCLLDCSNHVRIRIHTSLLQSSRFIYDTLVLHLLHIRYLSLVIHFTRQLSSKILALRARTRTLTSRTATGNVST